MLKDIAGSASDELDLKEGANLGAVYNHYATKHPRLREYEGSIVLARNCEFAGRDTLLADGDEVAFLPPVSGGSGPWIEQIEDTAGHFFALTRQRIDTERLVERVLQGADGAVVRFEGVVRNNSKGRPTLYLDYECYEAMAVEMMARIGREIAGEHQIGRIAMVHRLGRMEIGETSVAIIVTAPHRQPAFAAALEGINRLKRLVPIWKKEHFADGEVWVEGEWDPSVLKQ
ncbi:MAG: molybdenum cofactor biosynthesis protein MoaD [bacterium]|nr:molybdenum cofactor biosynthesis protein MoaD [bacterium]